ncbi:hypothetical protein AX15_002554 [Amanita polypyramis BW_CC]|nr:hypothetical protein AX15_002554 [Amanita polypyramis BW_CC]
MNKYTWSTMMNDYVFLEDMSRNVGKWGEEIVRGGYVNAVDLTGRDKRGFLGKGKGTRTKRHTLKVQLGVQEIEMELQPQGMERKKMNQSFWDFKKKTGMLTIEFKLHTSINMLTPSKDPPFRLLTHRNDMDTPLLTLIQKHLSKTKRSNVPPWAKLLVVADTDDPESFKTPYFVMPAPRDVYPTIELVTHPNRPVYYRFDPTQSLSTLLKGTRFAEFPTIEICEEFNGIVVDTAGSVSQVGEDQPRVKRRKLAQAALNGLLGEYGSDEEEREKVQNEPPVLVEYADSASEEEDNGRSLDESSEAEGVDEDVKVEPGALLELLRKVRNSGPWTEDGDVDWAELSEEDPK